MMAGKKYYAVKVGRETGIFTTWDACKAQVQGYSGAVYKSFATLAEAQEYLTGTGTSKMANTDDLTPDLTQLAEGEMVAYVDGSFLLEERRYAFGAVIFYNGKDMVKKRKRQTFLPKIILFYGMMMRKVVIPCALS